MERMAPLAVDKAPVEVPRADRKGAHWIEPKLVAEIAFAEFTDDGILRHPSFIGAARGQAGEGGRARSAQHTKNVTKQRSEAARRRRHAPPRTSASRSAARTA